MLVVGHPFIDIWEAVKPSSVGIAAWPKIPHGEGNDLVLMCYMSQDFREGMDAFLNKRKPVWKGR